MERPLIFVTRPLSVRLFMGLIFGGVLGVFLYCAIVSMAPVPDQFDSYLAHRFLVSVLGAAFVGATAVAVHVRRYVAVREGVKVQDRVFGLMAQERLIRWLEVPH
jgi:hypothetical protein